MSEEILYICGKYNYKALFLTGMILSFSLCLDLGIVNVYLIKTGIEKGGRTSFLAGLGSSFGDVFYAILAVVGIGFLVNYEIVQWVLWILGTIALCVLAIQMLINAFNRSNVESSTSTVQNNSTYGEFAKGLVLALASPSSIIWFATVGGAIIATTKMDTRYDVGLFIFGFFSASVIWSAAIAIVSHCSKEVLGYKLVKILSFLSALLFAFLAIKVGINGYQNFINPS